MLTTKQTGSFNIDRIIDRLELSEGDKVADLGCGNFGFFVWPLAKLVGRRGLVYAVDVLKGSLDEIKRRARRDNFPQVKPIWSDLEIFKATPIEPSSLEAALLVNVLHQSKQKASILREASRLLKNGGRLAVIEWSDADTPLGPDTASRIRRESLKATAIKLGLAIQSEFIASPYHYGVILIKL